jgi:predicted membrane protein (TIGR00267 family)
MSALSHRMEARRHHDLVDPHHRAPWLADVVLGGQDGIVNVLGVVLGVAAATRSARIVLVAGLAAAFAESVSMAAVAYTSTKAEGDLFKGERAREYRHIEAVPGLERAEIRAIYARKGFSGDLLERIVETITSNKDVWVAVMMAEEHGLVDSDRSKSLRSSAVVGLASLVGSLLPLAPFLVLPVYPGAWMAVVLSASVLFGFGVYKARVTVGHPLKSGLELAAIGTASALVGYAVGALFQVPP